MTMPEKEPKQPASSDAGTGSGLSFNFRGKGEPKGKLLIEEAVDAAKNRGRWVYKHKVVIGFGTGIIIALAGSSITATYAILNHGKENPTVIVATPTPSAAAGTPRPKPESTPRPTQTETSKPIGNPIEFTQGEIKDVPGKTVISGDVIVNGRKLYDDDPATGLEIEILDGATIKAPFGASGKTDLENKLIMDRTADQLARETFRVRPEIKVIFVVYFQNGQIIRARTVKR